MTEDTFLGRWEKVIKATPRKALDLRTTSARKKGHSGHSGYDRHENDWYIESERDVDWLLDRVEFDGPTLDPACGRGNIPQRFLARGLPCVGYDLVDRGYGTAGGDFLAYRPPHGIQWANIVTNPPYRIAREFIEHALTIATRRVAALVQLRFLAGQRRGRLYRATPPEMVLTYSVRPSMPPGDVAMAAKGGKVDYVWMIWNVAHPTARGDTRADWLP
jgi:hypothetical protein